MRKARRRSVVEGGVTKHSTPINRRRTFGGVIGDKVFITVVAYHLKGRNSKADLRELAAHTLADFDLTGAFE